MSCLVLLHVVVFRLIFCFFIQLGACLFFRFLTPFLETDLMGDHRNGESYVGDVADPSPQADW